MGQKQGALFDTSYIDSLTNQIDGISVCSDLQAFIDNVMGDINAQISAVQAQIAALKPIIELLENPAAEIPKIIEWIGKLIEGVLKPMYQPVVTMMAQIEHTAQAVIKLEEAVVSKASEIGSCIIDMPASAASEIGS